MIVFSINHCSFDRLKMSHHSLTAWGTDMPFSHKSMASTTHELNVTCSKTLIWTQLFVGHAVGSRSLKRKEKINRIIIIFLYLSSFSRSCFTNQNKGLVFFHTFHELFPIFPHWQLNSFLQNIKIFVCEEFAVERIDFSTHVAWITELREEKYSIR